MAYVGDVNIDIERQQAKWKEDFKMEEKTLFAFSMILFFFMSLFLCCYVAILCQDVLTADIAT